MESFEKKISIGTAQFGLDYGIANKSGQVSQQEVANILHYAAKKGVVKIDTAQAYGNSENVVGKALGQFENHYFEVTTKLLPENLGRIQASIQDSLSKLGIHKLDTVLYHDYQSWKENMNSIHELEELKQLGRISNLGFSLYFPDDLQYLLDKKIPFDAIQIPYNVFDRRFECFFPILKEKNIKIQIRSVFLQGLFFMNPNKLSAHFNPVKEKLLLLHKIANEQNTPLKDIPLAFVNNNPHIDTIILGVDSLNNLKDNLSTNFSVLEQLFDKNQLNDLREDKENIIIPSKWKI